MNDNESQRLSKAEARNLVRHLYKKYANELASERDKEMTNRSITLDGKTMRYSYKDFGAPQPVR